MHKLEKHIKQKLQQRELSPSEDAWAMIESQLEKVGPKTKSYTRWYAVAGIFLMVLLTLSVLWTSEITAETIQIVEAQDNSEQPIQIDKVQVLLDVKQNSNQKNSKKASVEIAQEVSVENNVVKEVTVEEVATASEISDSFFEKEQFIINEKVNDVFTKVALLESNNDTVTDAEVDSLLRAAERELLADKVFKETGVIDAMALLTEVEDELDRTFRDQIFEALKVGYTKLRTAVADRNN